MPEAKVKPRKPTRIAANNPRVCTTLNKLRELFRKYEYQRARSLALGEYGVSKHNLNVILRGTTARKDEIQNRRGISTEVKKAYVSEEKKLIFESKILELFVMYVVILQGLESEYQSFYYKVFAQQLNERHSYITSFNSLKQDGQRFSLEHIYNMDETGLFYDTLPNSTYFLGSEESKRDLRGSKAMNGKNRVTAMQRTRYFQSSFIDHWDSATPTLHRFCTSLVHQLLEPTIDNRCIFETASHYHSSKSN